MRALMTIAMAAIMITACGCDGEDEKDKTTSPTLNITLKDSPGATQNITVGSGDSNSDDNGSGDRESARERRVVWAHGQKFVFDSTGHPIEE